MRAQEEAYRILESALATASRGVDEAEVALAGGDRGITRFDETGIVEARENFAEELSIRVAHQGGIARVWTSDLTSGGVAWAAQEAKHRVERLQVQDVPTSLPEAQAYTEVLAYDPEVASTRAVERSAMAARAVLAAKTHGLKVRGQVLVERGSFDGGLRPAIYAIANTKGLLGYQPRTRVHLEVEAFRPDGGYGYAEEGSWALDAVEMGSLVERVVSEALVSGPRRVLPTGRYPAVLDASAVASMVRFIGTTAGSGLVESGASFLSDRLGEPVTDPRVTIIDDFVHDQLSGAPFDAEGVARQRVALIDRGVAKGTVTSWDNSQRLRTPATGHRILWSEHGEHEAAQHLVMDGGEFTLNELVEKSGRGVYVPAFEAVQLIDGQSLRLQGVTRGACRAIEGGKLAGPLQPMRFEIDVLELLEDLVELGHPRWAGGAIVPPIAVSSFPFEAITS